MPLRFFSFLFRNESRQALTWEAFRAALFQRMTMLWRIAWRTASHAYALGDIRQPVANLRSPPSHFASLSSSEYHKALQAFRHARADFAATQGTGQAGGGAGNSGLPGAVAVDSHEERMPHLSNASVATTVVPGSPGGDKNASSAPSASHGSASLSTPGGPSGVARGRQALTPVSPPMRDALGRQSKNATGQGGLLGESTTVEDGRGAHPGRDLSISGVGGGIGASVTAGGGVSLSSSVTGLNPLVGTNSGGVKLEERYWVMRDEELEGSLPLVFSDGSASLATPAAGMVTPPASALGGALAAASMTQGGGVSTTDSASSRKKLAEGPDGVGDPRPRNYVGLFGGGGTDASGVGLDAGEAGSVGPAAGGGVHVDGGDRDSSIPAVPAGLRIARVLGRRPLLETTQTSDLEAQLRSPAKVWEPFRGRGDGGSRRRLAGMSSGCW